VISRRTARFNKAFASLPPQIQEAARTAYRQFQEDPSHPSLHLKQVHPSQPIYSARISLQYRTLAVREGDTYVWFWIGSHAEYDQMIRRR